jgi:hypothetical protein
MFGVLERLFVVRHDETSLVLREYPLLAWLFSGALIIGTGNFWLLGLHATAVGSLILGLLIAGLARVRVISLDKAANTFTVRLVAPLRRSTPMQRPLSDLRDVTVVEFASGHTQLVVTFQDGQEMGLSVYSKDIADWKTPLADTLQTMLP